MFTLELEVENEIKYIMASDGVELMKMLEAMYQPEHEYVQVSKADFQHLDLKFYERVTESLISLGFSYLSDEEDLKHEYGIHQLTYQTTDM